MIAQKDKEIEELHKSIQVDERIADDENQDSATRGRAREHVRENQEQIGALENERGELKAGSPLRERLKNIL